MMVNSSLEEHVLGPLGIGPLCDDFDDDMKDMVDMVDMVENMHSTLTFPERERERERETERLTRRRTLR